MVERIHQQLKATLCARGGAKNWTSHLPWVMLGLRAAPWDETGVSAAEAALQQQLVVPGQLPAQEPPQIAVGLLKPPAVIPPTKRSYAEVMRTSLLDQADWVYIKCGPQGKPLSDRYSGPYKVLEKAAKAWKLQVGARVEIVSRDQLKPHQGSVEPQGAEPPKRGRPRTASRTVDFPATA